MKLAAALAIAIQACAAFCADISHVVQSRDFSRVVISPSGARPVLSIRFSPKKMRLATVSENLVCVWNAHNLSRLARFYNPEFGRMPAADADADFKFLYAASGKSGESGRALRINLETGEFKVLAEAKDEFLCAAVSRDSKFAAFGSADGTLAVFDADTGREVSRRKFDGLKVCAVAFNYQSDTLAAALSGGAVKRFGRESGFSAEDGEIILPAVPVAISFLPGSKTGIAAAAGFGHSAKIFFSGNFSERSLREIRLKGLDPSWMTTRPAGHTILACGKNGALRGMRPNASDPMEARFEPSLSRLEAVDTAPLAGVYASTSDAQVLFWQNHMGRLCGGIAILGEKGEHYALWTRSGRAFSTLPGAIKLLSSDGSEAPEKVRKAYIGREKAEREIMSKSMKNPPKEKPRARASNAAPAAAGAKAGKGGRGAE